MWKPAYPQEPPTLHMHLYSPPWPCSLTWDGCQLTYIVIWKKKREDMPLRNKFWWCENRQENQNKLEQPECLHSENAPAAPWLPILLIHIRSQNKTKSKLQIWKICQKFKSWNFAKKPNMWHTFWSCLIRCVNMKWIQLVLQKLQRRHGRTDRQTDDVKPVYPLSTLL